MQQFAPIATAALCNVMNGLGSAENASRVQDHVQGCSDYLVSISIAMWALWLSGRLGIFPLLYNYSIDSQQWHGGWGRLRSRAVP